MLPVPRLDPDLVQAYVGVRDPSSASVAVAEQVRALPTTTLELGDMLAVVIVGAVFPTETLAVDVTDELLVSVAVAVHVTVDPTLVSDAVTV